MAVVDDIQRLTAIIVRQLQDGQAGRLREQRGLTPSAIGKRAGATAGQIRSWETGTTQPTVQQALAWLTCLYEGPGH